MEKLKNMQRIVNSGIVAIVRAPSPEEALEIAEAIKAGGIDIIEVALTVPRATEVIRELVRVYRQEQVLIGAGTVLDAETAREAILAGAEFLVSPCLNMDMIKMCNRYQKISMPGAMSVKEIVEVMEAGGDFVKLFPSDIFGSQVIKAIKGPLPYAPLVPTGGISLQNVAEWIRAGCEAVGVGGELTRGAREGNYELVTDTARRFVQIVQATRSEMARV